MEEKNTEEFLEESHEVNEKEKSIEIQQTTTNDDSKKTDEESEKSKETEELRELVVVKESFFRKILNKIKKLFGRKEKINVRQQMEQKQEERKKDIVIPPFNQSNFSKILKSEVDKSGNCSK